jgi:hypothetical protein
LPLLFIISLISCKTATYTNVDKVLPPKYTLPTNMLTLRIVDRSASNKGNSSQKYGSTISMIDAARNTMISEIKNGMPLSNVKVDAPRMDGHPERSAELIKPRNIASYSNGSDGLLCLEQYDFQEQRNYKDIRKNQLDKDGRTYTIDAVAATRLIYLRTLWRMYDGKTGQVIIEIPQYSEDKYETEGLTRQGVNAHLDTTETVTVSTLSRQLSRSIINDINPKEITSSWTYYKKGNSVIESSASMIRKGDFRNAVDYLKGNIKSITSEKLKFRANYNLITSYYFNRQKEEALRLAAFEYNRTNEEEFKELYDRIYVR